MGSGKSTVGKLLAKKLSMLFMDTDLEIERRCGVSISDIFELEGEAGFRHRETQMINEICKKDGFVIATGGGVVTTEQNRKNLSQEGTVIYLKSSPDELWLRTRNNPRRPLLNNEDSKNTLENLLEQRSHLYNEIADIVIETGKPHAYETAQKIIDQLSQKGLKIQN